MSRENKLGLIIGFGIVLLVGVLISDHYSPASDAHFASLAEPGFTAAAPQETFRILQTEPLAQREELAQEPVDPLPRPGQRRDEAAFTQPPAAETHAEPIVIGGTTEDFGQQIRDLLGLTDAPPTPVPYRTQNRPTQTGVEVTHTVRKGESLAAIARRYYNDTDRWQQIYEANRHVLPSPDLVKEGVVLRIPNVEPSTAVAARPHVNGTPRVDTPTGRSYTIQKGDVLGVVSQKLTGTSRNWQRLYEANRDVIDDPDHLIPGTVIRIPADIAYPG